MNDDRMHPPPPSPGQPEQLPLAEFVVPSVGGSVVYDADVYNVDHIALDIHSHADRTGKRRHMLKVTFTASYDDEGYADPIADLDLI